MDTNQTTSVVKRPSQPQQASAVQPSANGNHTLPAKVTAPAASWWRALPTALVILLLSGLAWYGHHTGWTIPKFSDIVGSSEAAPADWCAEHCVPKSICVECNESLLPRVNVAFCRKHGVHVCPLEHPEFAQLDSPSSVTPAQLERVQRALALKERPENNSKCKIHHRRLQFAAMEVMDKMGIDIAPVWEGPIVETVTASGEIVFEQPRVAPVSTPVAGRVWYVTDAGLQGAHVKRGDILALVDAADIGKAKAELLQAAAQLELRNKALENLTALNKTGVDVPAPRMQEAQGAAREAQIRLLGSQQALVNLGLPVDLDTIKTMTPEDLARYMHFFGIPRQFAEKLNLKTTTANLFPILAPRDGVVSFSKVAPGEIVDPSKTMFVVADPSRMWAVLNVRLEDVKYLKVRDPKMGTSGQTVHFRPDGGAESVSAELVWRSTQVDERTRTVQFRAEVPNPSGSLLANTFGVGDIVLREEKNAVLVPSEALHWEGDCNIVFVRDKNFMKDGAPKVFHVRTVRPGVRTSTSTEIIAGLLPGEIVATKNSANIRSELLKNNLGAG